MIRIRQTDMIRKLLSFLLVFGFVSCATNQFTGNNEFAVDLGDGITIPEGGFEFPTADGAVYIQGTREFQKVPEVIIGSEDFEKMRDLHQNSRDYILGKKVGWLVIPLRNNPRRAWIGTGFLVGPDLFMTNHHCIHDDEGLLPLKNAAIFMDYYQERKVDRTLGGVTAGVSGVLRAEPLKDYALLRLDKRIGYNYGWLQLDTTTPVGFGQNVKLISHPNGREKEIVRRNSQIVNIPAGHPLFRYPFALAYLADTQEGSSGSPVFLRDGMSVIAIHHSGSTRNDVPLLNAGSLMSDIVPEIQQWLMRLPPTPPTPPRGPRAN